MNLPSKFAAAVQQLPLIAILRGLTPAQAPGIGEALVHSGFALLEVPLNSKQALDSIALLEHAHPRTVVGAGTVLSAAQVRDVHAAGGRLVVSPNFDAEVVRAALQLGLVCLPGVLTPSEAFAALALGAHGLKLFRAEMASPAALKALRAVLPAATLVFPVGGITQGNMALWLAAGANGFGIGSALYSPAKSAAAVREHASGFVTAFRAAASTEVSKP